jgi:AsmA protein
MGRLTKILGALLLLGILVVGGLAVFVRFYFTEDRLKALLIPEAENALGRTVGIGTIDVGLFSGVTAKDFYVKEADGATDFFKAEAFILRYDLWPLLKKRLVVTEVTLREPFLSVARDEKGTFNFQTLAFLAKTEQPREARGTDEKTAETQAAIPFAMSVDQIVVERARVTVRDALKEIPSTDAEAQMRVSLDLGQGLTTLRYKGKLNFTADAVYGGVKPHLSGEADFDQDSVDFTVKVVLADQEARISGDAKELVTTPRIRVDVTSDSLDLDRLMGVAALLPGKEDKRRMPPPQPGGPGQTGVPSSGLPPGLSASGVVSVNKALYKGLEIRNFRLAYTLEKGILSVRDLSANTAGGDIKSAVQIDLNQPGLAYSGQMDVRSLQLRELLAAFGKLEYGMLSGTLESAAKFSGAGTQWRQIRDVLSAEATYGLRNVVIGENPVTAAIAGLLGLEELRNPSFETASGNLHIEDGKIRTTSRMDGKRLRAETTGTIGLDGTLDLPIALYLSKEIAERVGEKASFAKYLTSVKGETVLNLKLGGTVNLPRPSLDTSAVTQQLRENVQERVFEELGKALSGQKDKKVKDRGETREPQAPAQELLKGIFGQ